MTDTPSLPGAIAKAAAFSESEAERTRHSTDRDYWVDGARWQSARLQPLITALSRVADIANDFAGPVGNPVCECDECYVCEFNAALDDLRTLLEVPRGE
jgi:hypothetical protein